MSGWGAAAMTEGSVPSPQAISEWLAKNGRSEKYAVKTANCAYGDDKWHATVHAPALLVDLFNELSDAKVEYRKTLHSIELTKWLLENKPNHLDELVAYVERLVAMPASTA
jgi:hypothetical protein